MKGNFITWLVLSVYFLRSFLEDVSCHNHEIIAGWKRYELSNHLGNVLSVVSDRKKPIGVETVADYYEPTILSATDYPFGMDMPGRSMSSDAYRYGFNGKEKDTDGEWGNQTHYNYGFRIYNPEKIGEPGILKVNFDAAIDLINSELEDGNPVLAGIDYHNGVSKNYDKTTNHFVGRGFDEDGG